MKLVLIDDELEQLRLYAHIADLGKWKRLCRSRQGVLAQMSQVAGQDGLGTSEGNRGRTDQHAKRYFAVVGQVKST